MVMVEPNEEEIDIILVSISGWFSTEIQYFPKTKALRNRLLETKTKMEKCGW